MARLCCTSSNSPAVFVSKLHELPRHGLVIAVEGGRSHRRLTVPDTLLARTDEVIE
jgi:hypothetical protein